MNCTDVLVSHIITSYKKVKLDNCLLVNDVIFNNSLNMQVMVETGRETTAVNATIVFKKYSPIT